MLFELLQSERIRIQPEKKKSYGNCDHDLPIGSLCSFIAVWVSEGRTPEILQCSHQPFKATAVGKALPLQMFSENCCISAGSQILPSVMKVSSPLKKVGLSMPQKQDAKQALHK